eukprot:TRINITY_DN9492_c0_g1_i1.p1 TRINITY_DN9492_c0_g1~~TRINITY_DN9492_c0_g1_i1.p1  ORF type:complete len:127 (+),score=43.64 TRINITY_DN9492_c0_g1_i1:9-389(+)
MEDEEIVIDEEMDDEEHVVSKTIEEQEKEDKEFYENSQLKFRNYIPRDPTLKKLQRPKLVVPEIINQITERIRKITSIDQDDLISLAPKKSSWDLQRDLERKMDKLDKKTQIAIYELIQEKLKETN